MEKKANHKISLDFKKGKLLDNFKNFEANRVKKGQICHIWHRKGQPGNPDTDMGILPGRRWTAAAAAGHRVLIIPVVWYRPIIARRPLKLRQVTPPALPHVPPSPPPATPPPRISSNLYSLRRVRLLGVRLSACVLQLFSVMYLCRETGLLKRATLARLDSQQVTFQYLAKVLHSA